MRFLHLGDLHLGKSLGEFDLIEDQRYILDQVLTMIEEHSVDGVLIAGDVYDKSVPSEAATNLLNDFLCQLAEHRVKTFMISGNHDSDDRLNYGSDLFKINQIYISAIYHGTLYKQTVEDEHGELDVYLLPFVKASQVRNYFPEEEIATYEDAVKVILKHAGVDRNRRNILVAHQFVTGKSQDPELGGSEDLATRCVGTVEKIGYDCFDAFDYVALGHIHAPQRVGRKEVRYSGSMLKYSLSEVHHTKSVPMITMGEKGNITIDLLPLTPMRDLRHIKGRMADLLNPEHVIAPNDFIYATLMDESAPGNVMAIFQQTYANTVKIDYENHHSGLVAQMDHARTEDNRLFPELIRDFYQMKYGSEISEEEMAYIQRAAKEVGIINETD